MWEPAREEVAGHPLTPAGGIGFEGRPQLAARLRGSGGGGSLLLNGHIDVVPGQPEQFRPRVEGDRLIGRGACDMKGGIAAMVIAAETLAAAGELRGDVIVCTNTDEESSGVGGLACARHGVAADFAIVPEPTGLEVWPACRGSAYCEIVVPGRAGHAEQEHADWREGGAVNAIEMARHLLAGVEQLRSEWRGMRHPLLSPPDIVATRLVADSGWSVTIPDRAEITLAVLILPGQADADGWRTGADIVKYGLLPLLGMAFTLYLWTQLSGLTFEIGLGWLAAGFVALLVITRMFRVEPPPMYTGDEEELEKA